MPRKIILHESHTTGGIVAQNTNGFSNAPDLLQSLGSTFISDGVVAGDIVHIAAGPEAGYYTVVAVPFEHTVQVTPAWPVGGTPGITFDIRRHNFLGLGPVGVADGPNLGGVDYTGCTDAGLFTFGLGGDVDDKDWITLQRFMLVIDEGSVTDIDVHIIPPEGPAFTMPLIVDFAQWSAARSNTVQIMLGHGVVDLRPGSQLRVRTTTCTVPQYCGVWWEKFHRVERNVVTDAEYLVY